MRTAIRDAGQLCRMLELPASYVAAAAGGEAEFSVFAPRGFVARMETGNIDDPLLRQVLPLPAEVTDSIGSEDPVGDEAALLAPGLLQKYSGRALLITSGACAIHCRYCFRRHYPYAEAPRSLAQWQPALEVLRRREDIQEILLSGGDPLTLVDTVLGDLIRELERVPHLRRLRIHTRLPIVIPERITPTLIACLRSTRLASWVVLHANHAAEIDADVAGAIRQLALAGIPLLNQAVLMRAVNDSVEALADLCLRLCDLGVMPYYLHQLDRVRGAAHFEVPVQRGQALMDELRRSLPGYAIPRYVCEVRGEPSKRILA